MRRLVRAVKNFICVELSLFDYNWNYS